ncbi:hypothetical protein NE237_032430 [Protea cynaroides]|uniref:TF-B3 domain-containing protein n=1 Tax=Protea cynaroides TaxID=273540 RepID=A0A9Q0L318_9MAGN|nr:hypothetical protein NE237_032430 [Protea cynaroides]
MLQGQRAIPQMLHDKMLWTEFSLYFFWVIAAGMNPIQISQGIEKTAKALVSELKSMSRELADVVAASAGNDYVVGNMIGVVTIEKGNSNENSLQIVGGMQFDRGYLSPYFVTDRQKMAVEFQNCKEQTQGCAEAAAIEAPAFGECKSHHLDDIAILTGGTVVRDEMGLTREKVGKEVLGTAVKVVITKDSTLIVSDGNTQPAVEKRVAQIRSLIENTEENFQKKILTERIARLSGVIAILKVDECESSQLLPLLTGSSSSSSNFINRNGYSYGSSSSSSSNFINRNGYYYGSSSSSSSNINEVPDDELSLQVQRVYINWETIEKGFLFSKLLNNSDSGKLNRLWIPIRKAEKYFPSLKKGDDKKMLLTFFDRNNKKWVMKYEFWSTSRCYVLTTGWKKFVNEYGLIGFVHEVFFYKIHDQLEVTDDQPLFIDFKEKFHDQQEVSDDQPLFIDFKKEEPPPTNPTSWLFGQNLILHDQLEVSDDQHLFIDLKKKDPPPTRLFGQNLIPHDQLEVSDDQHLFNDFKKKDPPPTRLFGQNLIPHDQLEVLDDQHLFNDFKKKDPPPTRLFGQNLILHDQLEVSDDPPEHHIRAFLPFSKLLFLWSGNQDGLHELHSQVYIPQHCDVFRCPCDIYTPRSLLLQTLHQQWSLLFFGFPIPEVVVQSESHKCGDTNAYKTAAQGCHRASESSTQASLQRPASYPSAPLLGFKTSSCSVVLLLRKSMVAPEVDGAALSDTLPTYETAFATGKSKEADAYSYGVALFELVTHKKVMEMSFPEGIDLVSWVYSTWINTESIHGIVDPSLMEEFVDLTVVDEVIDVQLDALKCMAKQPRKRPPIKDVVK